MASEIRQTIAKAILKAFERTYKNEGCSYDPDTCYEAADEVIAAGLRILTDEPYVAKHPNGIIGAAVFVHELVDVPGYSERKVKQQEERVGF